MRRALLLLLAASLLSACVAETVERRRPRKGPVKEVGYVDFGGGRVRYSAEGWGWVVASRRRLALKLMARNCGRDLVPKITDEYARQDADATFAEQDVTSNMDIGAQHYVIERYIHLAYECRDPKAPEPAVSTATVSAPIVVVPGIEASSFTAVAPSSSTAPSPEPPK
jgi:hypothetical protein